MKKNNGGANMRRYAAVIVENVAYIVQYGRTDKESGELSKGMENLKAVVESVGKDKCTQLVIGAVSPEDAFNYIVDKFPQVDTRGDFRGGSRGSTITEGAEVVELF